jgi:hypothetical protein
MISRFLCVNGVVIISSKRYYFGVGGGMLALEELIKEAGAEQSYTVIEKLSFEDGKSNVRDIIVMKRIV